MPAARQPNIPFDETHLTPGEIAKLWKLDPDTVRHIFADEPDVLKYTFKEGVKRGRAAAKRDYTTLRIPVSVMERVWLRRSRSRLADKVQTRNSRVSE